jgi:diphthine synthase
VAELWFIGAGLGDERDLSRRAIDVLRGCTSVFAEEYTAALAAGSLERLSRELGRPVVRLRREELEGERPVLDALDRGERVALVVPGDPFAATTHVALRAAAQARGHVWRYLPNASIATAAAGLLGLMQYRFGRIVSLPFPEPGFAPTSPVDLLRANRSIGLHTLVLLDLRPGEGRFLTPNEALGILEERDPERTAVPRGTELAVVARVGTDTAGAWYGEPERLRRIDFGPPMYALVVPAPELHNEERAAIERYRVPRSPA